MEKQYKLYERMDVTEIGGRAYEYKAQIDKEFIAYRPKTDAVQLHLVCTPSIERPTIEFPRYWIEVTLEYGKYIKVYIDKLYWNGEKYAIKTGRKFGECKDIDDLVEIVFIHYTVQKMMDKVVWNACVQDILVNLVPIEIAEGVTRLCAASS